MTVTKKTAAAETVATTAAKPAEKNDSESGIAPASSFAPSGAPEQDMPIDVTHPALDNDPRANTTAEMNQIDLNDPAKPAGVAVAEQLGMSSGD